MDFLCVSDLDGTLINHNGNVSTQDTEMLLSLYHKNIGFTLATGRTPLLTVSLAQKFKINLPLITCNGALITTPDLKEILWNNPIPQESSQEIIDYLQQTNADFLLYTPRTVYYPAHSQRIKIFAHYNQQVDTQYQTKLEILNAKIISSLEPLNKIFLNFPTPQQIQKLKSLGNLEVVSSMENSVEITALGSSKGAAVQFLSSYLGVPLAKIVTFGDNENDISMFSSGALSVAMGNSLPEIQKQAAFVTKTVEESGVSFALKKILFPKWGVS